MKRHQKPATVPPRRASLSDEARKGTTPKRTEKVHRSLYGRRDRALGGEGRAARPKADTAAHEALRYPRDFETAENGSRRLAAGNDIKNPPRLPATTPRSLRRTEKRHHPETHRESAPEALRPQEWLRGVSGLTTLTMFTTGLRGRCGPLERNAELLPSTLREGLPSSLGRAEKKFRSRKNKNPRYRSTGGS